MAKKGSIKGSIKNRLGKEMSTRAFVIALIVAIIGDLLSLIPIIPFGTLFILILRTVFMMERYFTKRAEMKLIVTSVIELIPAFQALPACTAFVVFYFIGNRFSV